MIAPYSETFLEYTANRVNGVFDIANFVLWLLPSTDGVALRRLLMTAVSALVLGVFSFGGITVSCGQGVI